MVHIWLAQPGSVTWAAAVFLGLCCVQVEAADVAAFILKLLQELARLVEAAAAAQQADGEGLCQLCEREMPLTKHHLIPR